MYKHILYYFKQAFNVTTYYAHWKPFKIWNLASTFKLNYRGSPVSTVSISAIPGMVEIENHTKIVQIPNVVRFSDNYWDVYTKFTLQTWSSIKEDTDKSTNL